MHVNRLTREKISGAQTDGKVRAVLSQFTVQGVLQGCSSPEVLGTSMNYCIECSLQVEIVQI